MDLSQIIFYGGIVIGLLLFITVGFVIFHLKNKDEGTLDDDSSDEEDKEV
jgi:hypothetical protein